MAKITVTIDLPGVSTKCINTEPDWFEGGMIIIDEAYLTRSVEDDSFLAFNLVKMEDDDESGGVQNSPDARRLDQGRN